MTTSYYNQSCSNLWLTHPFIPKMQNEQSEKGECDFMDIKEQRIHGTLNSVAISRY